MILQDFLKMVIGPEFVYCHVQDPKERGEFCQGFADDLIANPLFTRNLEVLSFYFMHSSLMVNARRIEK